MRRLIALCALAVCLCAHELTAATLAGRVLDPSSAVVPGVTIRVTNLTTQETLTTQSDPLGNYAFRWLGAGVYALSAEAQGFEKFERDKLELGDGENLTLIITLKIHAMAEQVQITAKAPNFDEVLTMRDVRESSARDLGEALTEVDGLWKIRKGGIANDVVLRGFQSGNINVLVDGARIFGACPNHMDPPAFHVDFSEIQEVVITKGAFDVENHGSLGGLIQIINKRPESGVHFVPNFSAGSFGFINPSMTGSFSNGKTDALMGYSFRTSDPYQDGNGQPFTAYANYRESVGDLNAFDIHTGWGKFGFAPWESHRLALGYTRQAGGRMLYPYLQMDALYDNADRFNASYDISHLTTVFRSLRFQGYFTQVEHWMTDEFRTSSIGAARPYGMGALATTKAIGGKIVAEISDFTTGIEVLHRNWDVMHTMRSPSGYMDQNSIPNVGVLVAGAYATYRKALPGALRLQAGGRLDTARSEPRSSMLNSDLYWAYKGTMPRPRSDTNPAGYVQLAYALGKHVEVFGGVGHTARLPDAQERYLNLKRMGSDWVGNPDLQPTRNTEVDLGINYSGGRFQVRPTVFYSRLTDFITVHNQPRINSVPGVVNTNARSYENVGARLYGGELSYSVRIAHGLLFLGGTSYSVGTKEAKPEAMIFSTDLAEIPPLKSRAVLRYGTKVFFAEVEGLAVNAQSRVDTDLKELETPGYATMGFKIGARTTRLNFAVGLDNVFDRFYYEHLSFQRDPFRLGVKVPEPGRGFYLTFGYSF
jgi:iron complex outermembrane recepter protein